MMAKLLKMTKKLLEIPAKFFSMLIKLFIEKSRLFKMPATTFKEKQGCAWLHSFWRFFFHLLFTFIQTLR